MIDLREITDHNIIKSILFLPCIWGRISEDGQTQSNFNLTDKHEHLWVGLYDNSELIGMYYLHPRNGTTIEIHIHIPEEHRNEYAVIAGETILKEWFLKTTDNIQKLIAEIPVIYPDVYFFTKKFGFTDEGINRKSFTKNGKIHNQYRLGVTKEEVRHEFSG